MAKKRSNKQSAIPILIGVLFVIAVVVLVVAIVMRMKEAPIDVDSNSVTSFDECVDAGGTISSSDSGRCELDGQEFLDDLQITTDDTYVGLSEQEALTKAEEADVPHRVVERDGEALPVTMDAVEGRLNFYVLNDTVDRVEVEGQAQDPDLEVLPEE